MTLVGLSDRQMVGGPAPTVKSRLEERFRTAWYGRAGGGVLTRCRCRWSCPAPEGSADPAALSLERLAPATSPFRSAPPS